jgi:protein arginine N-methyltransferase 2
MLKDSLKIDTFFQSLATRPTEHVIIEPHPDVLQHMKDNGWYESPGIKILEGKWQDVMDSQHILAAGGFDVIYIDTFSEDYSDLNQFFEHLPNLLAGPESRFSFFHGLGATSKIILHRDSSLLKACLLRCAVLRCVYTYRRAASCRCGY